MTVRGVHRLATPSRLLAIGVVTFVGGRLFDAWWHTGPDEFETGLDQVRAHWLAWLGVLIILAAGLRGVRERRSPGYAVALAGALAYAVVAARHFYEHTERREADVTHLLLVLANVVVLLGVVWVAIDRRRRLPRRRTSASTPPAGGP